MIRRPTLRRTIQKTPTGIHGFDEITGGGLPRGRPTLVCGGAGCGKTMFAMEFLVRGATQYGEPGVFMSFEESINDLIQNSASLGFDLEKLTKHKKIALDYVRLERSEIEETGEYDLEGLFIRLESAIDSIEAKRVALDTLESLFAGLSNHVILRAELRRLFSWLKGKGVTTIITAEKGDRQLTRHGLEEYVSDCVIALDHRVIDQISTRRLRVVKYRGSSHGTNEYPFLIGEDGVSVMPITSIGLDHAVSRERISSGAAELDRMLGGRGFYRGTSVLISGTAGTGKTSLAAHFTDAACRRGEKCLWFSFEESSEQMIRNMRSIGIDLRPWVKKGLLRFHAARSTSYGLEMHLTAIHRLVQDAKPRHVILDPVTSFDLAGSSNEIRGMLARLLDYLKSKKITSVFTSLTHGGGPIEVSDSQISSLIDSWILLRDIEENGERNRGLYVLKSRGMAHSNQIREFILTDKGIRLVDVYLGSGKVLTGSARVSQEMMEKEKKRAERREIELRWREVAHKRETLKQQISALEAELAAEEAHLENLTGEEKRRRTETSGELKALGRSRRSASGDSVSNHKAQRPARSGQTEAR